jgi:hypothetical protein
LKILRFAGFDCISSNHLSEGSVISLVVKEKRLFLSRNKHLSAMIRHIPHLIINGEYVNDQLQELKSVADFSPDKIFSRCTICNHLLIKVPNLIIKADYIPENPDELKICPHCNQYYWKGSHYQRMTETLLSVFK